MIRRASQRELIATSALLILRMALLGLSVLALSLQIAQPGSAAQAEFRAFYIRYQPGQITPVLNQVERMGGRPAHVLEHLSTLAVSLPIQAAADLQRVPGVIFIEEVPEYRLTRLPSMTQRHPLYQAVRRSESIPWFVELIQARDAWDGDHNGQIDPGTADGSGIKICIIDTGLWTGHDDFIGLDVSGLSQIPGENWDEDGNGHGTHVTGIIGAQLNQLGMVGALPGAELFIVKVFNNAGQWVDGQSNLAAAIYACKDAGAQVINMSLAGDFSVTEQAAMQDVYEHDQLLLFSTSANSGSAAIAFPGYYESVINIGSVDRERVTSSFSQFPPTRLDPLLPPANSEWDAVELTAGGQIIASTATGNRDYPLYQAQINGQTINSSRLFSYTMTHGLFSGTLINGNYCQASDISPNWNGAVVLCKRGVTSFNDKLNQVTNGGGTAILIYNHVDGEFTQNCSGCSVPLPSMRLTLDEGLALLDQEPGTTVNLTLDDGSACGLDCTGAYAYYNGTSQAAPAAAAAAAWLWDACGGPTNLSNAQIRDLLRKTAQDLSGIHPTQTFTYGEGWDVATGWGIPQMKSALIEANRRYGELCPLPVDVTPEMSSVCTALTTSTTLTTTLNARFTTTTTLSLLGAPTGMSHAFHNNPIVTPTLSTTITLSDLQNVAAGMISLQIVAADEGNPAIMDQDSVILHLADQSPQAPELVFPTPGSTAAPLRPLFTWNAAELSVAYRFELALDTAFTQVIESSGILQTSSYLLQTELEPGTIYYWRVFPYNACGIGAPAIASFRTPETSCLQHSGQVGALNAGELNVFTNTVEMAGEVVDINVRGLQGTHTNTEGLTFWLSSPTERAVKVIPGFCPGTDFDLDLDDKANSALDCALNASEARQPVNSLAAFAGQAAGGDWVLEVANNGPAGNLDTWELAICTALAFSARDFSDLPASYGTAWHHGDGNLRLGDEWTSDSEFSEEHDNETDDGVSFSEHWWQQDHETVLTVRVSGGSGWLAAWADWNADGNFENDAEKIVDQALNEGDSDLAISIPTSYLSGQPVHARFRLYPLQPSEPASPEGGVIEGEVEDYWWRFTPTAIQVSSLKASTAATNPGLVTATVLLCSASLFIIIKIQKKVSNP
jgi:subtilisin family serine protease